MKYILKVTLEPYGTGFAVGVDESNKANEIKRGTQKISWRLSGNAYQGSFVSFKWLDEPPAGTFDPPPKKSPAGKHLNVTDKNGGAGSWRYKLTIEVDGTTYSTRSSPNLSTAATSGGATLTTVTNPIIRNK